MADDVKPFGGFNREVQFYAGNNNNNNNNSSSSRNHKDTGDESHSAHAATSQLLGAMWQAFAQKFEAKRAVTVETQTQLGTVRFTTDESNESNNGDGDKDKNDPLMQSNLLPSLDVRMVILDPSITVLTLTTNESYSLSITAAAPSQYEETETSRESESQLLVTITAETCFGVRHGLETLFQLVAYDEDEGVHYIVSAAEVEDAPAFPYR